MKQTLYSRHLSEADIILMSPLTFSPRSNLSIAQTCKNESQKNSHKKFLYILFQTELYIFFKFLFNFVYVIFEPVYGLFWVIKIKISWNFKSVINSRIDAFRSCKDVQSTIETGIGT